MRNPSHLLTVPFVIRVLGEGLVAHVVFPNAKPPGIRPGTPIVFIRPNGTAFHTTVRAINMVMDARPGYLVGIVLPANVRKEDIPYGSMMRAPSGSSASTR
jgi:hypothetical protein